MILWIGILLGSAAIWMLLLGLTVTGCTDVSTTSQRLLAVEEPTPIETPNCCSGLADRCTWVVHGACPPSPRATCCERDAVGCAHTVDLNYVPCPELTNAF